MTRINLMCTIALLLQLQPCTLPRVWPPTFPDTVFAPWHVMVASAEMNILTPVPSDERMVCNEAKK